MKVTNQQADREIRPIIGKSIIANMSIGEIYEEIKPILQKYFPEWTGNRDFWRNKVMLMCFNYGASYPDLFCELPVEDRPKVPIIDKNLQLCFNNDDDNDGADETLGRI